MRCDDAAPVLGDMVDLAGAGAAAGPERDHIDRCLRCQAELAQHRKIRRAMAQMRRELAEPGPDLLDLLLASIDAAGPIPTDRSLLSRHRTAYMAAAATAATAAGAVVLASRSRRIRLRPTG